MFKPLGLKYVKVNKFNTLFYEHYRDTAALTLILEHQQSSNTGGVPGVSPAKTDKK
nr:hypothetical protein [Pedobacter panaciterrae]